MAAKQQKPKRIKILNLTWNIKFVDKDISNASSSLGWCDYEAQVISLYDGQTIESLSDTFLHEILHALFWSMGIDPNTDEEKLVSKISTGLCTVFSNNPKAFKWWSSLL